MTRAALPPLSCSVLLLLLAVAGSCAGCSEECSGQNQGSETCPCQSDLDCSTKAGAVLLCQEGSCAGADPPDATAVACDRDSDCGKGELCGLGLCQPAPTCQRIDPAEFTSTTRRDDGVINGLDETTLARDGCSHELTGNPLGLALTVSAISPHDGRADVTGDCSEGQWFASRQAGVFRCGVAGNVALAVARGTPCWAGAGGIAPCPGSQSCVALGSDIEETAGVCQ